MRARKKESGRAVRLADIARSLGIAVSTVSMAIADNPRIAEATRRLVREKADEMGFRPNPNAQRLVKGAKRGEVAVLIDGLDEGVPTQIARDIRRLLTDGGYRPTLHIVDPPGGGTQGQTDAVRALRYERPEGIVFSLRDVSADTLNEFRRYRAEGGALASYSDPLPLDCDQAIFDEEHATRIAVERLVEMGHQHIGFCPHGEVDVHSRRSRAFLRAMDRAGLPVPYDIFLPGGGYEAGGCEIARRFIGLRRRPTALLIVNDAQATGFVAELYRQGFRAPQYVSVIGTDDLAAAACGWLPLSTVSLPSRTIAETVVAFLTSRLKGEATGPARFEMVRGELIERESTAPPRALHWS